jgi:hypothetical protein
MFDVIYLLFSYISIPNFQERKEKVVEKWKRRAKVVCIPAIKN